MSVKLPQAQDYGARPSLQSGRIDEPAKSGQILANSVAQAADTFNKIVIDTKQKKDRLNYALAKQEIMKSDLQKRDELSKDPDYKTHDERYQTEIRKERDGILGKYELAPSDMALITAESDVTFERGRIEVAGKATEKEYSYIRSTIDENLIESRELALNETNFESANAIADNQIESLRAAQEKYPGIFTDEEVLAKSQAFIQDLAAGSLDGLNDVDAEIAAYEASLALRSEGGAIKPEEISAGKGSGSMADYLPRDEVVRRLELAKKTKEQEDQTAAAYAGSDAAYDAIGDKLDKQKERRKFVKNMYKDDPQKRDAALGVLEQRWRSERLLDDEKEKNKYRNLADTVSAGAGDIGINELPAKEVSALTPAYRQALDSHIKRTKENKNFADSDDWDTTDIYADLTAEERIAFDADDEIPSVDDNGEIMRNPDGSLVGSGFTWRSKLTRDTADSYTRWGVAQKDSGGGSDKQVTTGGLTQTQIVERQLIQSPWFKKKPTTASPPSVQDRWNRTQLVINNAIIDAMEAKGSVAMPQKLTSAELTDTINLVLLNEAYIPVDVMGPNIALGNPFVSPEDLRKAVPVASLATTRRGDPAAISELSKEAFVPIEYAEADPITDPNTGNQTNVRKWLENIGSSLQKAPSQRDYEEAYFYYLNAERLGLGVGGKQAAENRLKGVEGY